MTTVYGHKFYFVQHKNNKSSFFSFFPLGNLIFPLGKLKSPLEKWFPPLENAIFSETSDNSRLKVEFPRGEFSENCAKTPSSPMGNTDFTEEFSMNAQSKSQNSFAEILENLSHTRGTEHFNTHPSTDFSAGWKSSLDPQGLAQIIGFTPVFKTGYKKYVNPARPRIPHIMTAEQTAAFENLSIWSESLTSSFNRFELKSSYRQALLKTHPDQGGSAESFLQVKKSYEILSSLVTS